MKIFKVGQKVVALNETDNQRCQQRKKGYVYTVLDTMFCDKCGSQIINVLEAVSPSQALICGCHNVMHNKYKTWTYSEHFASFGELESAIKEYEKVEDYEMCGTLLKILNENK